MVTEAILRRRGHVGKFQCSVKNKNRTLGLAIGSQGGEHLPLLLLPSLHWIRHHIQCEGVLRTQKFVAFSVDCIAMSGIGYPMLL